MAHGWVHVDMWVCRWVAAGASQCPVLHVYPQVIEPGQVLLAGQIYDSNKTTLMAALREQGFECHDAGLAEDE